MDEKYIINDRIYFVHSSDSDQESGSILTDYYEIYDKETRMFFWHRSSADGERETEVEILPEENEYDNVFASGIEKKKVKEFYRNGPILIVFKPKFKILAFD